MKVAAPRSNKAPISSAGTMRQGRKNNGSPLKTASAKRTRALNARNAAKSSRSAPRRVGNSTVSIERHARDRGKLIGAHCATRPASVGPLRPARLGSARRGLKRLLGRRGLQSEVHAQNLLGALDLRGQPGHSYQSGVEAA